MESSPSRRHILRRLGAPLAVIAALGMTACRPTAQVTKPQTQHHVPASFQPRKPVRLHVDQVNGEGLRSIGEYYYADTSTPAADGKPVLLHYRVQAYCDSSLAADDRHFSQTMINLTVRVFIPGIPQIDIATFTSRDNQACQDRHHVVSVGDTHIVMATVTNHLDHQQF
jgi:hypothetical protein